MCMVVVVKQVNYYYSYFLISKHFVLFCFWVSIEFG